MSHACPISGVSFDSIPRYPRHVCEACARKAVAADGRPLRFSNVDFSGGFEARYADTDEAYASHACRIEGICCHADEAHFGGIVIEVAA
jgi:hypothetical protein